MSTRAGRDFGKYTIVHRLRAGGVAEAYLCRLYGIEVVVRRIRPAVVTDPALVQTFLEEARIAAHLRHPNIVQVHEIDLNGGLPFVVMEHVRGPSFERVIQAAGDDAGRYHGEHALLCAAVARALEHAHGVPTQTGDRIQIVHGELTERNIVISDEGVPKVLDFGVAQARGGPPLDPRLDVFALGKCLYHATTGRPPTVTRQGLVRPTAIDPAYPTALEQIVLAALETDPVRRTLTAGGLATQLEEFAARPEIAAGTRPMAEFLDALTLDFDEPLSFGSDDGYARRAVVPRSTGAAFALVVESIAKRPWALPLGGLTAVAVIGVLAAIATPLFERDRRAVNEPPASITPLRTRLAELPRAQGPGSRTVDAPPALTAPAPEPEARTAPAIEVTPPVTIDVGDAPAPTRPRPEPCRTRVEVRRLDPPRHVRPPVDAGPPAVPASPAPVQAGAVASTPGPFAPTPMPAVLLAPWSALPPATPRKAVIVPTAQRLPTIYIVQSPPELDKMLALVEREAIQIGKAPAAVVRGVTRGLALQLRPRLATGVPLEVHPVTIYTLIVRGALEGGAPGGIGGALRQAQAAGKL